MNLKAQAILKFLLSASEHKQELLRFLPHYAREDLQTPHSQSYNNDCPAFLSLSQWAVPIHFSWFLEAVQDFPPEVRPIFLHVLTEPQAEGLHKLLSIPKSKDRIKVFARPFLMDILHQSLIEPDLLAESFLPDSPLNKLLHLQRKYLIHLVDFLGLHDLAADLRQVVDKELLRKIYQALSAEQLRFLHYCSKQSIKWVSPKLGLNQWDGSKKRLNHLLHYRGLTRFAKAIGHEDKSFKWHLLHRLDTGRAKIIQQELYKKQDPSLARYFKNQVLHIAKRYPL